jgi:hypothetical protein
VLAGEGIAGGQEVGLSDVAGGGVGASGDDEEVVDFAIVGAVGALFEAGFTDGAAGGDEPGDRVFRSAERGNGKERIVGGAGSTHGRLRVAGEALVGVEAGAEAVVGASGDDFDFAEANGAVLEEGGFVRGKPGERAAGTGNAAADSGIDGTLGLRAEGWTGGDGEGDGKGESFGGPCT